MTIDPFHYKSQDYLKVFYIVFQTDGDTIIQKQEWVKTISALMRIGCFPIIEQYNSLLHFMNTD